MVSDTVVAIVPDESLSDVLTQVHRAGLGNNARVLRPRRSPMREQLQRAGLPVERAPDRIDAASCILMVMAAARSQMASELILQHGASAIWIVTRSGDWRLCDDGLIVETTTIVPTQPAVIPAIRHEKESSPDSAGPI